MNKKGGVTEVIVILIFLFGIVWFISTRSPGLTPGIGSNNTACTADAKLCPDGNYVGRTGPNCEFVCVTNISNKYPNPKLTPGDILTTNASIVCVSGYTATVRDVPTSLKKEVYTEYNLAYPEPTGTYECDHFIPLELGGSNDIKNLWPEPAEPVPGFRQKDRVENYLHDQVCSGKMTLEEAQKEIRTDWYKVYKTI